MKYIVTRSAAESYQNGEASLNRLWGLGERFLPIRCLRNATRVGLAALLAVMVLSSCTQLRSGVAVKAGFNADTPPSPVGFDPFPVKESWASRHVPGWKAINRLLPPPSEARRKWDERYRNHYGASENDNSF
jgi:hypothetical protein